MTTFQRIAKIANKAVFPILNAPVIGQKLSGSMATISYVGRRSGKEFSAPVAYTRKDDRTLTIGVAAPDQKSWWRNFYPDGGPITVDIGGVSRTGTAVAQRDDERGTRVTVTFDKA